MTHKLPFYSTIILSGVVFYFIAVYGVTANLRPQFIVHNVPFAKQAPFGEWNDPRQRDGCEEAAMVMAMAWARGGNEIPPEEAKRDIINISEYERVMFGFFQDTSIADTARLMREVYNHQGVTVQDNIDAEQNK